jgi:threonine/homoserine/homoserine lactone efflux protein
VSLIEISSLFIIMVVLAALPSTSVALVIARSATHGFADGAAVSLGIVCGDLVFILLTLTGLAALAEITGSLFLLVKYIAAVYLIWLGVSLLRTGHQRTSALRPAQLTLAPVGSDRTASGTGGSMLTSYLAGLLLTLADIKAIFFYLSLLPTFVDPDALNMRDFATICLLTIVSVGGVKLVYAFTAASLVQRTSQQTSGRLSKPLRYMAGGSVLAAGCYLLVKD